jgi:hypothetical protein
MEFTDDKGGLGDDAIQLAPEFKRPHAHYSPRFTHCASDARQPNGQGRYLNPSASLRLPSPLARKIHPQPDKCPQLPLDRIGGRQWNS